MKFLTSWDRYLHIGTFPLPSVRRIDIPGAPEYLRGLKVLFVSDVHLRRGTPDEKLSALIDLISAQHADLILLGGDYAEGNDQCIRFFESFRAVRAPLGCFGVDGNNDDPSILQSCMEGAGAVYLRNCASSIDLPGGRITIGGCENHLFGRPETRDLFSNENPGTRILLSHYPVLPDCACELMLSGHTHGGQMSFFGITPYSIGFERPHRLCALRGLHRFGDMHLAVSSGIGVSRLPLRAGVRPEILVVNFQI